MPRYVPTKELVSRGWREPWIKALLGKPWSKGGRRYWPTARAQRIEDIGGLTELATIAGDLARCGLPRQQADLRAACDLRRKLAAATVAA